MIDCQIEFKSSKILEKYSSNQHPIRIMTNRKASVPEIQTKLIQKHKEQLNDWLIIFSTSFFDCRNPDLECTYTSNGFSEVPVELRGEEEVPVELRGEEEVQVVLWEELVEGPWLPYTFR